MAQNSYYTDTGLKICKFIYCICNWIWTRCSHFFSAHPHMLQVQTQSFKYLSFTTSFLLGRTKYFVTVKWSFLLLMFKCFWRFLQSCNWKEILHLHGVFFNVRVGGCYMLMLLIIYNLHIPVKHCVREICPEHINSGIL